MTEVIGGLAFGVLGSAHCVAMCGPLVALAGRLPAHRTPTVTGRMLAVLRYHLGRLAVYALLGALVGALGVSLAQAGLGRALAITAGCLLLAQAITAAPSGGRALPDWATRVTMRVVGGASAALRRRGLQGPLILGALNGLLPCGLLYAALTASAGFGSLTSALTFMVAFGVATVPLLAVVSLAADPLARHLPLRVRRAGPVALAVVGVLLIVRGVAAPHAQHGADPTHAQAHVHAR